MSDRKHTPDILAEILTGDAPAAEMDFAPPRPSKRQRTPHKPAANKAATPKVRAATQAARPKVAREQPAAQTGWEYQVVSFQIHNGWQVRYIDGKEVKDWAEGFSLSEYNAYAGEQGWELAGACSGTPMFGHRDTYQLFYKRPKA